MLDDKIADVLVPKGMIMKRCALGAIDRLSVTAEPAGPFCKRRRFRAILPQRMGGSPKWWVITVQQLCLGQASSCEN